MMTLLAPWGLAALAALAVPLFIHWIRRSDRQLVSFAAMRYLREVPHSREKFRLHERLLLLLRMLLISSLALLLAVPIWRERGIPQSPWILVAPGVDAAQARANVGAPLAVWHWLAPGLPSLETPAPTAPATALASLTSLVREVDASLTPETALTIVVPAELSGLDAERLQLSRPVTWRPLPGRSPETAQVPHPTLTLAARYDPIDQTELPLVRALAAAWQANGLALHLDIAPLDTPLPPLPAWLIWLGGKIPPAVNDFARRGGSVLASRSAPGASVAGQTVLADETGAPVLRRQLIGAGRVLTLATPLRAADVPTLATPEFPKTLADLMQSPVPAPDRAPAASVAPLPKPNPHATWGTTHSLAPYLSIVIGLLFLIERVYATRIRTKIRTRV